MPEAHHVQAIERNDFSLLQFGDFVLLGREVRNQGLLPLRNGVNLQPLNVLLLRINHLLHRFRVDVQGDGVFLKTQAGKGGNDAGESPARPLANRKDRVVKAP